MTTVRAAIHSALVVVESDATRAPVDDIHDHAQLEVLDASRQRGRSRHLPLHANIECGRECIGLDALKSEEVAIEVRQVVTDQDRIPDTHQKRSEAYE